MSRLDDIRARIEKWNLEQYHCDYLAKCLNSGSQPIEWTPHVGERSQARADAERLVAALVADGLLDDADALSRLTAENARLRDRLLSINTLAMEPSFVLDRVQRIGTLSDPHYEASAAAVAASAGTESEKR